MQHLVSYLNGQVRVVFKYLSKAHVVKQVLPIPHMDTSRDFQMFLCFHVYYSFIVYILLIIALKGRNLQIPHDKNSWFLINYVISNIYNLILMIQGTTQIRTAVLVPQVSRIEKSLEKSELHIRIIGGHFPNSHFSLSSHQSTGRIHLTSPQITIGSFINQFIHFQPVRLQQLSFDVPFR